MEGIPLEHLKSRSVAVKGHDQQGTGAAAAELDLSSDPALKLIQPLLRQGQAGPSTWNVKQVIDVRRQLSDAVESNKIRNYALVSAQFADISAQVRTADHLKSEYLRVEQVVQGLEAQMDHASAEPMTDDQTSFLPPVLDHLSTHFRHVSRREQARAHLQVTRAIRAEADRLKGLEEAIWAGRGAQEDVLRRLLQMGAQDEDVERSRRVGLLKGTKVFAAIELRTSSLCDIVRHQVQESFDKLVKLETSPTASISLRSSVSLPEPRAPRPERYPRPPPSSLQSYRLPDILLALHLLGALEPHLDSVIRYFEQEIIPAVLEEQTSHLTLDSSENLSSLKCVAVHHDEPREAREVLDDVRQLTSFIDTRLLPAADVYDANLARRIAARKADLGRTIMTSMLHNVLIPSAPSCIDSIPGWLSLLAEGVSIEESLSAPPSTSSQPSPERLTTIATFLASQAGETYATRRAQAALEDVKQLVLGGWGGWDAMEVQKEREEVRVVLVEEDVPEEAANVGSTGLAPYSFTALGDETQRRGESRMDLDADTAEGWGFDDVPTDIPDSSPRASTQGPAVEQGAAEGAGEGWGFDDDNEIASSSPAASKPTAPPAAGPIAGASAQDDEMDEGWDFELASTSPTTEKKPAFPAPAPSAPAALKPKAREAKKLGKKIGQKKAKLAAQGQEADHDHSGSDIDMASSVYSERSAPNLPDTSVDKLGGSGASRSGVSSAKDSAQTEGWGWDDDMESVNPAASTSSTTLASSRGDVPPPAPAQPTSRTHTVVKEEKVTFVDTFLVSKACAQLIELVQRCLMEASALHASNGNENSTALPSPLPPPFAQAAYNLITAASSVLTLFRALIFASPHVSDVPTLGMQLSNDCAWIADHLPDELAPALESTQREEGYVVEGDSEEAAVQELPKWDREAAVALIGAASVHAYESQLAVQREGIMRVLRDMPELGDVGDDTHHRAALRGVEEIKGTIDSLGRVWKLVLPRPQYLSALGYLVDITLSHLISSVLALLDIPQVESDNLVEILTVLKGIEGMSIFDAQPASSPSTSAGAGTQEGTMPISTIATHVPHWLKYVYLVELLGASLLDIGQLLDHGALVDFEQAELVQLIRALFAESELREGVVARIEAQ